MCLCARALLSRLQMSFDRFSTAGFMNQSQFDDFCVEMGMADAQLARRLFAAMDDDGCGALEPHEFVIGLQIMCDHSYKDAKARQRFAFHLFDEDRGGLVELQEAEGFVLSFERASAGLTRDWAGCLEEMFGKAITASPAADAFPIDESRGRLEVATKEAARFCEDFVCLSNLAEKAEDADVSAIFKQVRDPP